MGAELSALTERAPCGVGAVLGATPKTIKYPFAAHGASRRCLRTDRPGGTEEYS